MDSPFHITPDPPEDLLQPERPLHIHMKTQSQQSNTSGSSACTPGSVEDVISRTSTTFGIHEARLLIQLTLVAAPTAAIIFLSLITTEKPEVCVHVKGGGCEMYTVYPLDVCGKEDWEYTDPLYTLTGTYNLLCRHYWERRLPSLLFYVGMLPSCILAGYLSDIFGRKLILMVFFSLHVLFQVGMLVTRTFYGYLVLRFLAGLSVGYFVVCQTLLIEGLRVEYRHVFLAATWTSFSAGTMILGVLSLLFDRYPDMLACVIAFNAVLWAVLLLGVDESIRWLILKGKRDKAIYLLRKVSHRNNMPPITSPEYDEIPQPDDLRYRIRDFFVLAESRWTMLILLQISAISFYFLTVFTEYLTDDILMPIFTYGNSEDSRSISLILDGLVNITGVLLAACSNCTVGRRPTISMGLIICAAAVITDFISESDPVHEVCSYTVRLSTPGLVYVISLYSLEVYPTPLRARAIGLVIAAAAFGGIIATLKIILKMSTVAFTVIEILEMVMLVYCIGISLFLRETRNRQLPEYIEDIPGIRRTSELCVENQENTPLLKKNVQESSGLFDDSGGITKFN